MADEQLLQILKTSVPEWNRWRLQNPETQVDFTGANLQGRLLTDAVLNGVGLKHVNLTNAELSDVDLSGADLRGSMLAHADLTGADLRDADLTDADLRDVVLIHADLTRATVTNVNLSRARLYQTVWGNVNLRNVIGLDFCEHIGPSILDFRTLIQSGPMPVPFLRGCGLPESLIEYLPSLLGTPIEFSSCFISYSTQDQEFGDSLHADLQNKGVRCWFAPHKIQAGKKINEQIDEAIRLYDRLLLILSDHSMKSEWVRTEIAYARQKELTENRRVLFPISLVPFERIKAWKNFDADTGKDSAREIREYFIPDFSNWKTDHDAYTQALERLLKDLRTENEVRA